MTEKKTGKVGTGAPGGRRASSPPLPEVCAVRFPPLDRSDPPNVWDEFLAVRLQQLRFWDSKGVSVESMVSSLCVDEEQIIRILDDHRRYWWRT